ncbi:cytochrome P450 [Kitasatospora sp. NPDC093102]|uniref:cytochrome P450 n=1 Tax=Kitasatospora sp. NPDC093102 TaxID=3155069 RepID=UPI00343A9FEF
MLLGEAFQYLTSPAGRQDPYPAYAALRAHGPVVRLRPDFYAATGYDAVNALLRDPRLEVRGWPDGAASRLIADSMMKANGPDHARVRRLAADAFSPRRTDRLKEVVTAQAAALADHVAHLGRDGEAVDLMAEFAYPLTIRIIGTLLGVPAGEHQWLRERAQETTAVLEPFRPGGPAIAADRAALELEDYVTELTRLRRTDPGEDLITALVLAHDRDGSELSTRELVVNLVFLLLAGFETSANLLGNGLGALLDHPDLAARLRTDPDLADRYVEEVSRFDAPLQLTSRWAPETIETDGIGTIEKGSHILVLLGAGNHDPAHFAAPERFDPFRDSPQSLSFGAGAHYCLGSALARTEARLALPLLLERLPAMKRAGTAARRDRLTFRGYAGLPVSWGD